VLFYLYFEPPNLFYSSIMITVRTLKTSICQLTAASQAVCKIANSAVMMEVHSVIFVWCYRMFRFPVLPVDALVHASLTLVDC
jgi:hypothetical protein